MKFVNIAAYRFVSIDNPLELKGIFQRQAASLGIKGTLLIATEGINLMLSAPSQAIEAFIAFLEGDSRFQGLAYKKSFSDTCAFRRLLTKVKKEIITTGMSNLSVEPEKAHYLSPQQLKSWLDEHRDFTFVDTRNTYEYEVGRFAKAETLPIENFSEFNHAVEQKAFDKKKPVVMYCTGGIRCEKASLMMQQQGFDEVYQLHGGILQYFEECGGEHYQGDCFVFDERIALNPQLEKVS